MDTSSRPDPGAAPGARPGAAARGRVLLLIPCGAAMLMGLDAALVLLGLPAPLSGQRFSDAHAMLMAVGFIGALVSLERSVSIRRPWAHAAPVAMALGALATVVAPVPVQVGRALMAAGCAAMCLNYGVLWRRNREPLVAVQIGGGLSALCATLAWLGGVAIPNLAVLLVSFLVLTVVAERLDLSRIGQLAWSPARRRRHEDSLVALAALLVLVGPLTILWPAYALPGYGVILIVLAIQSASGDVARRGVRVAGPGRFTALMILAGYGWLAAAGLLLLRPALSGLYYDAILHAVFLGFVLSMVAAHASTILPTLLGVPMRFVAGFWGVGLVLHLGLLVRVGADLAGSGPGRQVGALATMAALLGLVAVGVWASVTRDGASGEQPHPGRRPRPDPAASPDTRPAPTTPRTES